MTQAEFFQRAIATLERLNITYLVVGSVASMAYGEPRMTHDIDIVVDLTPDQIDPLCDAFPMPEFYVSKDAACAALKQRSMFNIIHTDTASKIDVVIPKDDAWSAEQMSRRQRVHLLENLEGFAARPEDVIIGKMIYFEEGGSEKHLRDIASMMKISGDRIDRPYIEKWAKSLNLEEVWAAILQRVA